MIRSFFVSIGTFVLLFSTSSAPLRAQDSAQAPSTPPIPASTGAASASPAEADERPPIRPVRAPGLTADIAALLLGGQDGGDIPIQVLPLALETTGGAVEMPVVVELDAGILFDSSASETGAAPTTDTAVASPETDPVPERLEIFAYALADDGSSIQDSMIQAFEFDVGRFDAGLRSIQFVARLELPRGTGSLKILVRHPRTGKVATRSTRVIAPGGGLRLQPLVLEPRDAWIRLREMQSQGGRIPLPAVFEVGVPAAHPILAVGETLRLRVLAQNLDAMSSELKVELISQDGRRVAEQPAAVVGYGTPNEQGLRFIDVELDTTYLPRGSFDLKIMAPETGGAAQVDVASRALPITIDDAEMTQGDPWPTYLRRLLEAPTQSVDLSAGNGRGRTDVEMAPLLSGLREAFGLMAEGEDVPARRRLYALARELEKNHGNDGMKALGRAQIQTLRRLGKERADVVIPVISLDLALYREARERGRSLISSNARLLILRLVDLYIEMAGDSPAAKRTAANVLVSLGGELQSADMIYFSEGLFRRALDLDPTQRAARLALGMTYHVGGDPQRAKDAFQTLAEQHDDAEALVRLAVLEQLDGWPKEARKRLRQAVAIETAPDWVASLAHQELARLYLDAGDVEEATKLLESAVARLPHENRLRYLLAFVYRAAGAADQAAATIAEIGPAPGRLISARRRFAEWPQEAFVEANSMLHAKTNEARALLAPASTLEIEE